MFIKSGTSSSGFGMGAKAGMGMGLPKMAPMEPPAGPPQASSPITPGTGVMAPPMGDMKGPMVGEMSGLGGGAPPPQAPIASEAGMMGGGSLFDLLMRRQGQGQPKLHSGMGGGMSKMLGMFGRR